MSSIQDRPREYPSGLAADVADLDHVALRDRWGLALVKIGWFHLVIFSFCQLLYGRGDRAETHFLPLWGVDLAAAIVIFRAYLRRPIPSLFTPVARVWITFLILTFSTATMNSLVGFETDWFKAVWATLGTFGFATMAWIFNLRFLVPAVQMSLTAMLIARLPDYAYGIYGVSWCIALNLVGLALERRRVVGVASAPRSASVVQTVEVG